MSGMEWSGTSVVDWAFRICVQVTVSWAIQLGRDLNSRARVAGGRRMRERDYAYIFRHSDIEGCDRMIRFVARGPIKGDFQRASKMEACLEQDRMVTNHPGRLGALSTSHHRFMGRQCRRDRNQIHWPSVDVQSSQSPRLISGQGGNHQAQSHVREGFGPCSRPHSD